MNETDIIKIITRQENTRHPWSPKKPAKFTKMSLTNTQKLFHTTSLTEKESTSNKQVATIQLLKLWSAFSKSIRVHLETKGKAVNVKNLGTFYPASLFRPTDPAYCFMPCSTIMAQMRMSPGLHPDWYNADLIVKCPNKLNFTKVKKAAELPPQADPEELI